MGRTVAPTELTAYDFYRHVDRAAVIVASRLSQVVSRDSRKG